MRKIILFISVMTVNMAVKAGNVSEHRGDTLQCTETVEKFRFNQMVLPASLVAVGAWGMCNGWLQSMNHKVNDGMTDLRGNHYFHADDYIQYLPVVSHLGLGTLGVKCRHSFKERLAVTATAYLSMGLIVNVTKMTVNYRRPDTGARNSFPSGHTATAFMGAELVRMEYNMGIGIGAYAIATSVAILRLYNERHWLNDVIAGAGVGILSARIGYWLLPFSRRLFGIDELSREMAFIPVLDSSNRSAGFALVASF